MVTNIKWKGNMLYIYTDGSIQDGVGGFGVYIETITTNKSCNEDS